MPSSPGTTLKWKKSFYNNGSRDIPTPKTMCNYNITFGNEMKRLKLVILQSFSVLCYMYKKWEHFQITKFNRVYMAGGQALPSATFSIQILLIFLKFKLPHTDLKLGSSTVFSCFFSFLVFTKCQVLNLRMSTSRDPLL